MRGLLMKDFSKRYSLLIIIASFIASMIYSARLPTMAENATKKQDQRTVRVTTGIQQVQGWEQGLVRANPNLARWHWDPIYSYKQGISKLSPEPVKLIDGQRGNKVAGNPGGAAYKYHAPVSQDSRPKHIPFSDKALEEVNARYAQPVKPQHEDNVYGKLNSKETQAKIISPESPTIATYGYPYKVKTDTTLKYSSDKTSVYGQLLSERQNTRHKKVTAAKLRKK